jgi:ribosomal protein L11 methyltransferase
MEIGACSTSIVDADRGTQRERPIFGEPGMYPFLDNEQQVRTGVWNRCNVTAFFPASIDLSRVISTVSDTMALSQSNLRQEMIIEQVPNKDWIVHVQQSWKPIVVGDFVLRFPWHTDQDVTDVVHQQLPSDEKGPQHQHHELRLQGGIAFGTGEHPTTQLCMKFIQNTVSQLLLQNPRRPISILDYGSGSGVLGLAACAMSETVTAIGIDIDVDACQIANANARINNLPMRSYLPPLPSSDTSAIHNHDRDFESKSLLYKAHAHVRQQQNGGEDLILPLEYWSPAKKFDICVANILVRPLVALAPTLASFVRPGGFLGLSGILGHSQGEMVITAYHAAGFQDVSIAQEKEGWILVTAVMSIENS